VVGSGYCGATGSVQSERWLVAGLALACSREPAPEPPVAQSTMPNTRKAKLGAVSRTPHRFDGPPTPKWVPIAGGALALSAVVVVGAQIGLTNQVQTISSQDEALDFVANPMTPCVLRVQVTQQVLQQLASDVSVPAAIDATNLDRRCAPMINFASDALVQQQRFDEAEIYTLQGVEFDPLLDLAWVLRSRYLLGIGDLASASAAAEEARRVQNLYPVESADPALVESLLNDIELARERE